MKKSDFVTNIILLPIDYLLLISAAITAYYFRFSSFVTQFRPIFYDISFSDYLGLALEVSLFGIVVFIFSGFYHIKPKKLVREIPRIVSGVSTLIVFLILAIFLERELFSSRFIIIFSWFFAIIYLISIRFLVHIIRNYFFRKGYGLSSLVILGEERKIIVNSYKKELNLGFKVLAEFNNLKELQNDQKILDLIKKRKVDYILETDSGIDKHSVLDLLTFCQENHIILKYVASLFQTQSLNFNLDSIAGLPLVEIQETPLEGWQKVIKIIFDLIIALFLILLLFPFFIIIAFIIKLDSSGPIFVSLKRVGKKGELFNIYKFRSMVKDAQKIKNKMMANNERNDGPLFKIKNDPRITKFGKFLRRYSLDELPQLFNILKGEMSLVGPRPHEPEEVDKYKKGYKKLLTIRPGISGLAQVSGRSNLVFSEEAKLDIFYIENWSLFLDLIIIIKTIRVVFKKEESY